MRTIFSTEKIPIRDRFRSWQEISRERLPPFEMRKSGDGVFEAHWEGTQIGGLSLSRTVFGAHRLSVDSRAGHRNDKQDRLVAAFRVDGIAHCAQYDRVATQEPNDLVFLDGNASLTQDFATPVRTLRVEVPRERLERMIGPARLFASLPVSGDLPGTALARTFFAELTRVHETLSPGTAERMASIGIDLLVASVAERLARETPKPLQGTVTVQRAKAYVEANLGDPGLDPPRLAAAMGVSLRRLQELFHAHGRHISDWIWERRLEVAARRLADPGYAHQSIGALSYGCGFANQTHFSKRFRDRFGVASREYRRQALMPEGQGMDRH